MTEALNAISNIKERGHDEVSTVDSRHVCWFSKVGSRCNLRCGQQNSNNITVAMDRTVPLEVVLKNTVLEGWLGRKTSAGPPETAEALLLLTEDRTMLGGQPGPDDRTHATQEFKPFLHSLSSPKQWVNLGIIGAVRAVVTVGVVAV